MKKYRIYIDETGNPDLISSENLNHRFLSLTGVIFDLEYVKDILHPEMESLKSKFFNSHPDEPVIFHRKEMVNHKHPFEVLRDPEINRKFNEELLQKLSDWEYLLITVLIDKKEHDDLYRTWKYDPYHYCLAILMERYIAFLEAVNSIGDVMAESRGGKEDRRLKDSFERLCNSGTDFIEALRFQKCFSSRQLKVKPKNNNIDGLQIADILAHPSRRDILFRYSLQEKSTETFGDRIVEVIQKKYFTKKGKLLGYGIKKLP